MYTKRKVSEKFKNIIYLCSLHFVHGLADRKDIVKLKILTTIKTRRNPYHARKTYPSSYSLLHHNYSILTVAACTLSYVCVATINFPTTWLKFRSKYDGHKYRFVHFPAVQTFRLLFGTRTLPFLIRAQMVCFWDTAFAIPQAIIHMHQGRSERWWTWLAKLPNRNNVFMTHVWGRLENHRRTAQNCHDWKPYLPRPPTA